MLYAARARSFAAICRLLHAVHESDTLANERQEVRAVQPSPPGLRHVEELVSHQQPFRSRARALRHALTRSHGRERRLDHVGGAKVSPVLGPESVPPLAYYPPCRIRPPLGEALGVPKRLLCQPGDASMTNALCPRTPDA
jgi:hypothetical protein